MAWCLMVPSHYLNFVDLSSTRSSEIHTQDICTFEFTATSPRRQWVNSNTILWCSTIYFHFVSKAICFRIWVIYLFVSTSTGSVFRLFICVLARSPPMRDVACLHMQHPLSSDETSWACLRFDFDNNEIIMFNELITWEHPTTYFYHHLTCTLYSFVILHSYLHDCLNLCIINPLRFGGNS